MLLKFEISTVLKKPSLFYKLMGMDDSLERREFSSETKIREIRLLKQYLTDCFSCPSRFLISRRWTYQSAQNSKYIIRPLPENIPENFEQAKLAFICHFNQRARTLEIEDAEARAPAPAEPNEMVFEGTLSDTGGLMASDTDDEAIDFLYGLPETGADINQPLSCWTTYLDWRQKLAEKKANETYEYAKKTICRHGSAIDFYLKEPEVLELIKTRLSGEAIRVYTEVKETTEDEEKVEQPKAVFEAAFRSVRTPDRKDSIRGKGNYQHRSRGKPKGSPEDLIVSVVVDDTDRNKKYQVEDIPDHGFLRAAMEGELAAVDIQRNGLRRLAEYQGVNPNIRRWLFDVESAIPLGEPQLLDWLSDQKLNEEQLECVNQSLQFEDLLLLWGPPGTGKTTVITEISSQACRAGKRVLISSQANLAVDLALKKLPKLPHIRPARVSSSKQKNVLGIDIRNEMMRWLRSVAKAAQKLERSEEDSRWQSLQQAWCEHLQKAEPEDLSEPCSRHYLRHANVIGATCLETGKPDFINGTKFDARFDLSIVDEVSKATPPELLLPCLLGKRTILVGDHRQLPPVFRESTFPEAIENGELNEREFESFKNMVTTSMFEVFYERADQSIKCGLCQQYRMHPQIMAAVNQFYADSPLSAGGGDERLSEDKKHQYTLGSSNGKPWLEPGKHLVWVDSTYTHDGKEVQDEKIGTSRLNEAEAMLCVHLLKSLLADESTVALISLYRAQIQNIERLLRDETDPKIRQFIENRSVNTVDQFQGSERDVVIVSLTRTDSQLTGEFIKDFRRINVAISRAKKLLIIIGRRETFDSGMVDVPSECGRQYEAKPVYREIREIARSLGGYVPLKVVLGQNAVHSRIHRSDGLASLEDELNASNL